MLVVSTLQPSLALQTEVQGVLQQALVLPELLTAATQIDVPAEGTPLRLDWPPISGATEVALDSARVTVVPPFGADAGLNLGHLKTGHSGTVCKVVIPDAPRVVRSLYLSALRLTDSNETPLPDRDALQSTADGKDPMRLAVAVKQGGVLAPIGYAVPHIGPSPANPPYAIPPLLSGASYDSYRLSLPDVLADELHIMVVTGDAPEDFTPVDFKLKYVSAMAAPSPLDITLNDANGAPFYTGSGPIVASTAIDAKNAVQRALEAAIDAGDDPSVELTLTARTVGKLGTYGIVASGEVRRLFDDKISVTLEGAGVTPTFPGAPLDTRTPNSATADVVIEHAGARRHELSDALPSGTGGHSGQVLSMDAPLWQPLLPQAMRGEVLRRVGIIGYGLDAASLSLRVLGASPDGSLVAPPDLATGTCEIDAPDLKVPQPPCVHWFDLGEGVMVDQPIGLEVTAQSGRFLWIEAAGRLLAQFAVAHTLQGGEVLRIGNQTLPITDARTTLNGHALTPGNFARPPSITSDHFLTLTLSRLTLGYAP